MHLLVATDLSKGSVPAAQFAFECAEHADGPASDITVGHIVQAQYARFLDGGPDLDDPETHEQITKSMRGWLQRNIDRHRRDYNIALCDGHTEGALEGFSGDE